jgi:hypothetical protein
MIWVALAIIVIGLIADLCRDAAWKRSRRCKHGVPGDCPNCREEAEQQVRAHVAALAETEARRLENLDEAFFAIDEITRARIIDVLEDHWVDADLPDWTPDQMKQTVVKVYQQSVANEGKPTGISGASIRMGNT